MSRLRVAIASPLANALTETFIRVHIERLDADVFHYFGGRFPLRTGHGERWDRPGIAGKIERAITCFREGRTYQELASYRLAERLRSQKVDVVLAEYGPTGVSLLETCRIANIPLVVHFHGRDASDIDTINRYAEGYKRLFDEAAGIIVVSKAMKTMLQELGAPKDRMVVNPCGVNLSTFQATEHRQPGMFLSVGRFVEKKAPPLTLMAFRHVWAKHRECRLVMIGDGPLVSLSRDFAYAFGMADAVDFRGALPHEEVARAMQEASVFVQHSIRSSSGDMEGTPVAVIEACASALPVVATRHAGIPDVVEDGKTGWLVEEGDILGMGKAMENLVLSPETAEAAGKAGRKRIEEHFSIERSIATLQQVLENAC